MHSLLRRIGRWLLLLCLVAFSAFAFTQFLSFLPIGALGIGVYAAGVVIAFGAVAAVESRIGLGHLRSRPFPAALTPRQARSNLLTGPFQHPYSVAVLIGAFLALKL